MSTQDRFGRVVGPVAVIMVLLSGCAQAGPAAPATEPGSPPPPSTIDWGNRPAHIVDLGDGFGVRACEGDAPLLCVERDGEEVGQIAHFSFEMPAGDSDEVLRALVEDDYSGFRSDREGCADGFTVETEEPEAADVAGEPGIRSAYALIDADGNVVERYVKYWATSPGSVHLISAEAQDEGTCYPAEGSVFGADALEDFEPSLESLAERSRFPQSG